jgi:hypothetical protein
MEFGGEKGWIIGSVAEVPLSIYLGPSGPVGLRTCAKLTSTGYRFGVSAGMAQSQSERVIHSNE